MIALRAHTAPLLAATVLLASSASAQHNRVPHPRDVLGFEPGADYQLATYDQLLAYYKRLAASSARVRLDTIGMSVLGRPLPLLTISSDANLEQLDRWREISRRLAHARDLDAGAARRLAAEGKAVVWIDAGLHADEVAPAQHAPLLAWRLVTEESDEMRRIRENVVLLLMPIMSPDGLDVVTWWYGRNRGSPFETSPLPVLYHHYAGVDINRDWFMYTQPEARAVARQLYHEWLPQIVYNHHQAPPFPARIFVPPFAEPVNPNIPTEIVRATNLVGEAMARRFEAEGKSGVVSRVAFDMWWNGGMRSAPYFHNMVGILTETAQNWFATPHFYPPDSLPETFAGTVPARHPSVHYANPWPGGWWRLRDAVDYMVTGSLAVLDIAARLKDDWLLAAYRLGRASRAAAARGHPFAYVVPAEQWDRGAAVALLRALRVGGVEVHRATSPFTAAGHNHAAGTYILYAAQPFRPYLLDLMEKQVYPDRREYPGGPPVPPYDLSGWTLPVQMGVRVIRVDTTFDAAVTSVDTITVEPGRVSAGHSAWKLSPRHNNASLAVNMLLAEDAYVARDATGSFIIRDVPPARLRHFATTLGLDFDGSDDAPAAPLRRIRRPRVGLYKSWVGDWIVPDASRRGWSWVANIGEGWTRWALERHGFDVDTLHDVDIRTRDLARYDIIILPEQTADVILRGHAPGTIPPEYTGGIGDDGAARLRDYVERGGHLLAIDQAADFAIELFGLPVRNVVAGVKQSEFFIPGTLIALRPDTAHPLMAGVQSDAAAVFVRSRAFVIEPGASDVTVAARYPESGLLLSGWALGAEKHIGGHAAVVRARAGAGAVVLVGFRPLFRGQPHSTFKIVFNAIWDAVS